MKLRDYREKAGLSRSQLAEKAGVSVRLLERYEQGARDFNKAQVGVVLALSKALGVAVEDLIDEQDKSGR